MSRAARILLVDDSVVIRGLLAKMIDAEPGLEVVSTAADGRIGAQKVRTLDPDLVVLDVEMPGMDGLAALREIRETHPRLPVIMFSTLTERGATTTLEALAAGASDYAAKPTSVGATTDAMTQVRGELIAKIRALLSARRPDTAPPPRPAVVPTRRCTGRDPVQAVVVGSSTGGPAALERLLSDIARPLPVPMFIVQHMPPKFTQALAERLDRKTAHTVVEVARSYDVAPGTVYIAAGGHHMELRSSAIGTRVVPVTGPPVNSCLPAVDPLFSSAARAYGGHVVAVMLTGMGSDGTAGTRELVDAGADVIAQDEETSVVWGMPGSVVEADLACDVLPLDRIGGRLDDLVRRRAVALTATGGVR